MTTNISELRLGDFRKLYELFDHRLGESYCVDTACESNDGDLHAFSGAMCIRIYKESEKTTVKIYDPAYRKPSKDDMIVVQITMDGNSFNLKTKEIALARMEEESFFALIENMMNFELIYPDENDDAIDEMEKTIDNENAIKLFDSWVEKL